jgi:hypothetical protein
MPSQSTDLIKTGRMSIVWISASRGGQMAAIAQLCGVTKRYGHDHRLARGRRHDQCSQSFRFTPLHHAGEAGAKEAAAPIAKGADLTLRNRRNQTPIETAMAFGHPEVAEVMRQAMAPSK